MIAIVDYKAGNLASVQLALDYLNVPGRITRDSDAILKADRVIFPGDGAAGSAMEHLQELNLLNTLREVAERGTPFLGICLGMQVLFDHSTEDGGVDCLGIIPGTVQRFQSSDPLCKIPQMGWNTMRFAQPHPLFDGIEDESEFYFIHSYYPAPASREHVMGETEYAGTTFASAAGRDNVFATQYHPERSGRIGLRLLENFTRWDGIYSEAATSAKQSSPAR